MVFPDSKVHEAYMGPTLGGQDPGGPHVGPMNLAISVVATGFQDGVNDDLAIITEMIKIVTKIFSKNLKDT